VIDPMLEDAVIACADLVGRTGARQLEIGYLHDDVPVEEAAWWASAKFRGARIQVDNHIHPAAAAMALAVKLLTGAKCRCGKLVALSGEGATVYRDATMADGSKFTAEQAVAAGQCRWRLTGQRWEPSCPEPASRGGGGS
jgi:hypothetical protein